jgi:KDO2-lipid IV(A) lauroyltransferase
MLRPALELADRVVAALPPRAAYAIADLAGWLWHRMAPGRRRLVTANLARVCAATGRATHGPELAALVRAAFRNHARYYVELLRAPHYRPERVDEHVDVPAWPAFEQALRGGPTLLVSCHLGNFEPFGIFLGAHGYRPMAPMEEIEPRALYEFLAARRGSGQVDVVPLRDSARPIVRRLRDGGVVGIIGDRDLAGDGQEVMMFGHPTTMPIGPAALAVTHRAGLIVGSCLRVGPDRFRADGSVMELPAASDRRAATAELVRRMAAQFEADIAKTPEQWWGAFQPFWPDLRPA